MMRVVCCLNRPLLYERTKPRLLLETFNCMSLWCHIFGPNNESSVVEFRLFLSPSTKLSSLLPLLKSDAWQSPSQGHREGEALNSKLFQTLKRSLVSPQKHGSTEITSVHRLIMEQMLCLALRCLWKSTPALWSHRRTQLQHCHVQFSWKQPFITHSVSFSTFSFNWSHLCRFPFSWRFTLRDFSND